MESLTDQILKSDVIPIVIEKELEVKCCVRGHHVYESNRDAKTGSKLKPCHEKMPSALVEDKYAMALKSDVNLRLGWKLFNLSRNPSSLLSP